jgi:hypothetical protein
MDSNLSQSWLAQAGRSAGRDGLIVLGLFGITAGAIAAGLFQFVTPPVPALSFIARVLTAIGAFFLALPLFLGGVNEERWATSLRIAGLVVGFLVLLFVLI